MRIAARSGLAVLAIVLLSPGARFGGGPSAAATAPCGGEVVSKPSGAKWVCTFSDEFAGDKLDGTKWWVQTTAATGATGGAACFVASKRNEAVAHGTLRLTARKEAAPFTCTTPTGSFSTQYTSGTVSTFGRFSQAYGRFAIRAKVPPARVAGLQEALWLWPRDTSVYPGRWPTAGEIDIAEMYSRYPYYAVPYVHYISATADPNITTYNCIITDVSAFHVYVVEWTASSIRFVYDGRTCLTDWWNPAAPQVKPQPFDQPFVVALTQALGIAGNAFDAATTPLPATTQVDYVRVWR